MQSPHSELQIRDDCRKIVLCGGPYSNFAAVDAFLKRTADTDYRFCLGDIGGFGPYPNRTLDLIREAEVVCIQGNYDEAVGFGHVDCGCGYEDPVDQKYAQISFDYTFGHTSEAHKKWLRELPKQRLLHWRGKRILLCHGSPDEVNEFVWESQTSQERLDRWLIERKVDGICATHSGIPWLRQGRHGFWFNVGVLGRPAHEGRRAVYYGEILLTKDGSDLLPSLVPLEYDLAEVAQGMRAEGLPEEFAQCLETGVWTTCYGILPKDELRVSDRSKGTLKE